MSATEREAERRAAAAQGDLFDGDGSVGRGKAGRVERRVAAAIRAAGLADVDDGLAVLAIELGRACDVAARRSDPYAIAAAGRELRETLTRLKLDPTARGGTAGDPLDEWLATLTDPTVGDTAKS